MEPLHRDVTGLGERLVPEADGLFRFALSLTRDPELAADLTQDTMVRAMERADQFQGRGDLGAWLRSILHRLAIDHFRHASHEVTVESVEDRWRQDEYTVDPELVIEAAAERESLEDALIRLPYIYRSTVVLHDVEGWTVARIADLEGISVSAAKQRLRRGRMMLVSTLGEEAERRRLVEGVPMRCWDARRHVSDYLDGRLDAGTARMLEAHLETCPTCPPLYAALVGVRDELAATRDDDSVVPPDLARRIAAALGQDGEGARA